MRLLAATDFALRALMRLAAEPERCLSTEVLARELDLSRNHLHKVVTLALPPERISIGAVVRQMEDGQAIVECFRRDGGHCNLTPRCRLKGALAGAEAAFYRALDAVTLADCASALEPAGPPG
jgi:Rrf2 family nitric oxide-sensitive transcriptional repressor